jgi:glycerol-3-phosphate dehydrogenase (NAD(P)+)
MKIAVLGAGAWGTALACHAARRHHVSLWARDAQLAAQMRQERANGRYLPGAGFPSGLDATSDWDEALQAADLLVIATPLAGLRSLALRLSDTPAAQGRPVVWMCKGLEASTALLPHEVLEAVWPAARAGALSGPSFAAEVAAGLPVALVVASTQDVVATACQEALHHGAARIYRSDDLAGVETGGALKNIMAIAAGICDGLSLGMNARAALLTRGLAEMARYAVALGARRETLMGLAGMGDLVLTCTGNLSRNRTVGLRLAAGQSLTDILTQLGHVAEGVACCAAVRDRARVLRVDMPVTDAVAQVLFEGLAPREAVLRLLAREPRDESLQ